VLKVTVATWIGNAAAVLSGTWGGADISVRGGLA
jgi:hypothetical protein